MPGKAGNSGGGRSSRWSEDSPRDRPPMEMRMTGVGEPVESGVVDGLRRRGNGNGGGKDEGWEEERSMIQSTMKRNTRDHSSNSTTTILGTFGVFCVMAILLSDVTFVPVSDSEQAEHPARVLESMGITPDMGIAGDDGSTSLKGGAPSPPQPSFAPSMAAMDAKGLYTTSKRSQPGFVAEGRVDYDIDGRAPDWVRQALTAKEASKTKFPAPTIESVMPLHKDELVLAHGGSRVMIKGTGFGDYSDQRVVQLGATLSPSVTWYSPTELVAVVAPGVGRHLDATVSIKSGDTVRKATGFGKFRYSSPYIYDVHPYMAGKPVKGPANITFKAWGVGSWDTKPEAHINGIECSKSRWVDNTTVMCEINGNLKVALENPEVIVAGQRSSCHVARPGVCTVSKRHDSVNSPAYLQSEIREIKAHGGDSKWLERRLKAMMRSYRSNTPFKPCISWETCKPKSFHEACVSSIIMLITGCCFFVFVFFIVHLPFMIFQKVRQLTGLDPPELDEEDLDGFELNFRFMGLSS